MPSFWSWLLVRFAMLLLGALVIVDCFILFGLISGARLEEPALRVRWYGVEAEGWVALVPPHLFALLLMLANREATEDLMQEISFRFRYLWLWMTGR